MKINSIQYLRAVAAILVVYAHVIDGQIGYGISFQQNFLFVQNFGGIGVDFFFIISGFIIFHVAHQLSGKDQALLFLKKRFIRLNPIYYFASLLFLIYLYLVEPGKQFPLGSAVKTVTILPIFDRGEFFLSPIMDIGWTLAFEWFFYIIYAAFIWMKHARNWNYVSLLFIALSVTSFLNLQDVRIRFITNPICLEFALGIIIGYVYYRYTIKKMFSIILIAVGLGCFASLIVFGYGAIDDNARTIDGSLSWPRFFYWGIPSAIFIAGLSFAEKSGVLHFRNGLLLYLGGASYSIYLTHIISLELLHRFAASFIHNFLSRYLDLYIFVAIAIAVLIACVFHEFIEKLLLAFLSKKLMGRPVSSRPISKLSNN